MFDFSDISISGWCLQESVDDCLTRSLVLGGYDEDVIEAGLVYFLDQWEEAVAWRQKAYRRAERVLDAEFRYYLYCRSELDWGLRQVSVGQQKKISARIIRADHSFKKTLTPTAEPFCTFPEFIEIPEPQRHWWLFSEPISSFGSLRLTSSDGFSKPQGQRSGR